MGSFTRQAKAEFKQLPLMLGKLLGGFIAVIGFAAAIVIVTREPVAAMERPFLALLLSATGVAIFIISERKITRKVMFKETETSSTASRRGSALSWVLLLFFGGMFLICTYFLTK